MKISIVTVAYNSEKTIAATLLSIAAQSYPNIEHIVVDGFSTDRTVEVLKLSTRPPDVLISESDSGIYDAMNKGVAAATGGVICFLNSDDIYNDTHVIADVAKAFDDEQVQYVYGDIHMRDEANVLVRDWRVGEITERGLQGRQIPHPAFFVRRHLLRSLDTPFDASMKISADLKQQLLLIDKYRSRGAYLRRPLVAMRVGGASTSSWRNYVTGWQETRIAYNDIFGRGGAWFVARKVFSKIRTVRRLKLFSK